MTDFGHKEYKTEETHLHGGIKYKFKFSNGFGASVVRHDFSYGNKVGLWELAVLGEDGGITYETPITDDVLGYLTEEDVKSELERIRKLKEASD